MKVYHGSTQPVERPLIAVGRSQLDFGQGFYVTDIREQAEAWARRVQQIREKPGIVSVYEFDIDKVRAEFRYLCFERYDNDWLQFIISHRMGRAEQQTFDVVEGGVANDRVIDAVEAYIANLMPLDAVLHELSRHQPNNQLCIRNQDVINRCLTYVESYKI